MGAPAATRSPGPPQQDNRMYRFCRLAKLGRMNLQTREAKPEIHCDASHADVIDRVFQKIGEVSSLPAVAMQIMELAADSQTDVEDLIEAIRSDPGLAMRIMRTVNSSYHGVRQSVSDLKQAVTLLGFQEIRNLALSAFVSPLFRESSGYRNYSREELWNHMVGTGMVAALIAETTRQVNPHEAYLAGLLHDVGLVLIDQYLHAPFCRIIDSLTADSSLCQCERAILGFDHAELGAYVAAHWKLPQHLSDAIGFHHAIQRYAGPHRKMVAAVALGDSLCHLKGFSPLGLSTAQMPPAELFIELGAGKQRAAAIVAQLDETLDRANSMARSHLR